MKRLPVVPPPDLPGRREVLQWIGLGAALVAIPGCRPSTSKSNPPSPTLRFLTADEAKTLGALADAIIPPDDTPGGRALGAVAFIDRLLSVFDVSGTPPIFAGGPYSGRAPNVNADGTASTQHPANDFTNFLPLDRVGERAWRLYLYGSDAVEGGGPNDAIVGKTVGLRDQIRSGLKAAVKNGPIDSLGADDLAVALRDLDPAFKDTLIALVAQAAFGAPEYGGNPDGAGWKLAHFEGDVLPLGYSQWDATSGKYRERADAPVSTANPGPDPEPLDDDTRQFVRDLITVLGGKEFAS